MGTVIHNIQYCMSILYIDIEYHYRMYDVDIVYRNWILTFNIEYCICKSVYWHLWLKCVGEERNKSEVNGRAQTTECRRKYIVNAEHSRLIDRNKADRRTRDRHWQGLLNVGPERVPHRCEIVCIRGPKPQWRDLVDYAEWGYGQNWPHNPIP